jgi:hypothetical protein
MEQTGYSAEGSRYGSMLDLVTGPLDRSQYKEPDDVALAALDFLSSDSPKRRYMVVPNQFEAEITIRQALQELVQLNEDHPYSYTRDELVEMLDQALGDELPSSSEASPGVGLHEAAMGGNLQAIQQHIEAGADLNAREPAGGSSPLMTAATFGHTEAALALIEAGADLDQQNNDGSTALLTAAFFGRTEIVEALLAAGADKSIRNNAGSTALDVVTVPFESLEPTYDFLGSLLAPYGLELDYDRIKRARPRIAEVLR